MIVATKKHLGWQPTSAYLHFFLIGLGLDRLWGFTATVFGPVFLVVLVGRHLIFAKILTSFLTVIDRLPLPV